MRAVHGKLLISGIPRITRPRRRKNAGNSSGFSVVDPGGNWIRVYQRQEGDVASSSTDPLARVLENAVVLGDSHGDVRQATKILDSKLAKAAPDAPVTTLAEVIVYRAELALRLDDPDRAEALFVQLHGLELTDAQRASIAGALATAAELERDLHAK